MNKTYAKTTFYWKSLQAKVLKKMRERLENTRIEETDIQVWHNKGNWGTEEEIRKKLHMEQEKKIAESLH